MNAPTHNELLCLTFIAHCEKNSNYDPLTTKSESFFAHSNPSSHSTFKSIALTYNIREIHPQSTCSKWNMGDIFCLKFNSYYWICNFLQKSDFYEVKNIFQKSKTKALCMGEFQKKILDHFSPSFLSQKCLF